MSKYPNVKNDVSKCQNGVSKCQKYPNTQKCIEISNLDLSKCQKYLNVNFSRFHSRKVHIINDNN